MVHALQERVEMIVIYEEMWRCVGKKENFNEIKGII